MGIISGFLTFVVSVNGFVIILLSLLMGFFSHFAFGFAFFVLSFLVVITSPEFNLKIGENQWKFGIPVFPGTGFFRFALIMTVAGSIIFAIFGEETLRPYQETFRISKLQNATQQSVKSIKAGRIFFEEKGEWDSIFETKGIFLGEEKTTQEGELVLKFRLQGKDLNRYNGPVVWVPILMVGEAVSQKTQTSAIENKSQLEIGKEWLSSLFENEFFGVIKLTPEEVFKGDLYGDSPDKLKLFIAGFENGDVIEFQEDFWVKTNGEQNCETVLFADNKNIKSFQGDKIPRGTRFHVRGKQGVDLLFFSKGRTQVEFSTLVLKRIN